MQWSLSYHYLYRNSSIRTSPAGSFVHSLNSEFLLLRFQINPYNLECFTAYQEYGMQGSNGQWTMTTSVSIHKTHAVLHTTLPGFQPMVGPCTVMQLLTQRMSLLSLDCAQTLSIQWLSKHSARQTNCCLARSPWFSSKLKVCKANAWCFLYNQFPAMQLVPKLYKYRYMLKPYHLKLLHRQP